MLERVYIVYGFYSSYYHDFSTYEDTEQEETKIYGVYTSEEIAKQEAETNGLKYIGAELNTFLNDCREFWCNKPDCEKEYDENSKCSECKHNRISLYDSGYTLFD